jgi:hypothetical protein
MDYLVKCSTIEILFWENHTLNENIKKEMKTWEIKP